MSKQQVLGQGWQGNLRRLTTAAVKGTWIIGAILTLALSLTTLSLTSLWGTAPAAAAVTDYLQEQKFLTNVWQIVNRTYVDPTFNHQNWYKVRKRFTGRKLKTREETYTAIREMLASLDDPFTRLLDPEQFGSMQTSTSGALTGVGLQIATEADDKSIVVISPIEGSPADKAGVRSLDRIIKIDNVMTDNLTLDECAKRMRGPIGTEVTLTLLRFPQDPINEEEAIKLETINRQEQSLIKSKSRQKNNGQEITVTIKRERIEVNPIIAKLNQETVAVTDSEVNIDLPAAQAQTNSPSQSQTVSHKVGYIRLNQFNGNAAIDMAKAITTMESEGADQYVLDLRGNPGGLLDAGLAIARMWIEDGYIVHTVDRHGLQDTITANHSALTNDPLVILADGGSASASEVLAGALQDNHRAKIVGTRTFGKGLIQSLNPLEDGSGLAVTIAKYETPLHHDINRVGLTPDVELALTKPITREQLGTHDDPQYMAALQVLATQSTTVN
ncbi:MAG: S41 family peptidase [Pseudanabaenaceae cyanobacterium]